MPIGASVRDVLEPWIMAKDTTGRLRVTVKSGGRLKLSSKLWLERQLNDPYVAQAKRDGLRSRAAYKLIEIDGRGKVVAIDLLEMPEIAGVTFMQLDFLADDAPDKLLKLTGGRTDVVLSDMAANTTGHRKTDQLRILGLVEGAAAFASDVLNPGGTFVAKVFQSGADATLMTQLKRDFATVKHVKPASSRKDSSERYVLAMGFRGVPNVPPNR
jgi:23S rRNA (uridine2552-2'-O)-methyltransferase